MEGFWFIVTHEGIDDETEFRAVGDGRTYQEYPSIFTAISRLIGKCMLLL